MKQGIIGISPLVFDARQARNGMGSSVRMKVKLVWVSLFLFWSIISVVASQATEKSITSAS